MRQEDRANRSHITTLFPSLLSTLIQYNTRCTRPVIAHDRIDAP